MEINLLIGGLVLLVCGYLIGRGIELTITAFTKIKQEEVKNGSTR